MNLYDRHSHRDTSAILFLMYSVVWICTVIVVVFECPFVRTFGAMTLWS